MLAYVFWHHPLGSVATADYEANLVALHERLKSAGAVVDSVSFRISGAPWINNAGQAYEDWYLVDGWAELGALNVAAVSADRKPPHDDAAKGYAGGAGAVYHLRAGSAELRNALSARWFAKPRGMSYAEFDDLLAASHGCGGLWRRQLVLGPGTEFCVTTAHAIALPMPLEGQAVARALVS